MWGSPSNSPSCVTSADSPPPPSAACPAQAPEGQLEAPREVEPGNRPARPRREDRGPGSRRLHPCQARQQDPREERGVRVTRPQQDAPKERSERGFLEWYEVHERIRLARHALRVLQTSEFVMAEEAAAIEARIEERAEEMTAVRRWRADRNLVPAARRHSSIVVLPGRRRVGDRPGRSRAGPTGTDGSPWRREELRAASHCVPAGDGITPPERASPDFSASGAHRFQDLYCYCICAGFRDRQRSRRGRFYLATTARLLT
jgi:hypothetical protein